MLCLNGFTHHKVDTGRKQKGGNEGNATRTRAWTIKHYGFVTYTLVDILAYL